MKEEEEEEESGDWDDGAKGGEEEKEEEEEEDDDDEHFFVSCGFHIPSLAFPPCPAPKNSLSSKNRETKRKEESLKFFLERK